MDRLSIGQINLQGSAAATLELPAIAQELGLDVVLIQEPHSRSLLQTAASSGAPYCISAGDDSLSGILLMRRDLPVTVLHHLSNSCCTVCQVLVGRSSLYITSAYFKYSDDIDIHITHLNSVLDALRGECIVVGVDANAHSPMWHCWPRNYVGRGENVTHRRQLLEDFIMGRGLRIWNAPGEPATFSTINGESNIDLTLTSRCCKVRKWKVHPDISSSDHRVITYTVDFSSRMGLSEATPTAQSATPRRFRERGVCWPRFELAVHERVGNIRWRKPASEVCKEFTDIIAASATECLGLSRDRKRATGYEWWSPRLDLMRKSTNKARKVWQNARKRGAGILEEIARKEYHDCRSSYRAMMRRTQAEFFRDLANSGNEDPWGLAYRVATGRLKPPPNVICGTKFAAGYAGDVRDAMSALVTALCPDDDRDKDTARHSEIRRMAESPPVGLDASPPSREVLRDIILGLQNTAPGIDGITARIVKHVWRAADSELTRIFELCVEEGTFPDVWKDGRLVVLPKGNNLPLTDPKAYRPITLLSVLGKILERVILMCAPNISRNTSDC